MQKIQSWEQVWGLRHAGCIQSYIAKPSQKLDFIEDPVNSSALNRPPMEKSAAEKLAGDTTELKAGLWM